MHLFFGLRIGKLTLIIFELMSRVSLISSHITTFNDKIVSRTTVYMFDVNIDGIIGRLPWFLTVIY